MCMCPTCDYDLGKEHPWVECPDCGALVHQKVSKKGRVKKVILHIPGDKDEGLPEGSKRCPFCGLVLKKGTPPFFRCLKCRRVFMGTENVTMRQVKKLKKSFNLECDGDKKLLLVSRKVRVS